MLSATAAILRVSPEGNPGWRKTEESLDKIHIKEIISIIQTSYQEIPFSD